MKWKIMITRRHPIRDDRGLILPLTLLIMVILSALAFAILSIGGSETQIASNHLGSIQADFLAEAGLEHAFNTLRTTPALMPNANAHIADNISLGQAGSVIGTYDVWSQAAGADTVRVVSTGTTAIRGSQKIRRAIMSTFFHSDHALLTNGPLAISGNTGVLQTGGQCGNVHTNDDLELNGSAIDIVGAATASGAYPQNSNADVGPGSGHVLFTKKIPVINPTDFLNIAIATLPANQVFQMMENGDVLNGSSTPLQHLNSGDSYNGWSFSAGTPAQWQFSGTSGHVNGTYYFEGNVRLSGSPGSTANPWVVTLIATGNIIITGGPTVQTSMTDTLFIAGLDIDIHGNPGSTVFNGLIGAHEQFNLGGNMTVNGFVLAEDAGSASGLVTSNTASDGPTINYNCGSNPPLRGPLQILSWGL
ncbi:hypothetical protein MELA_00011 [Candidatus Methylomirabilis lanthanidiphila]|uniref:Type 4 fimbrial biogenesis protein PilX N-terminal domain-containing protein n=1 Tax=Candidatus Methylomirabilis lanthanidiphila TaxID=2211376 RepID=A0A564ZGH7_9BACT|nr:pilus assembly PilX N-terminal domain-containing protein [Candidatus Methylomirabilis lanthanidiphila]VUZ83658.1 hypothetical protein MELA_00011 [Candidatus Methylomirabilis lanthanidiphila]